MNLLDFNASSLFQFLGLRVLFFIPIIVLNNGLQVVQKAVFFRSYRLQ